MMGTAHALGIETLWIKDESKRSQLGSFKALGAPNALINLILKHFPSLDAEKFYWVNTESYLQTLLWSVLLTVTTDAL